MRVLQSILLSVAIVFVSPVLADEAEDEELARQQAFQNGMQAIVNELNVGSFDKFIASIDRNDFIDRIFGLRLIGQRIKRDFRDDMVLQFGDMVKATFDKPDDGVTARLLGVESRGDRGRAVVRYDLPDLQFNYHEYDLMLNKKGRVVVIDWIDFLRGEAYSDGVGLQLTMAAPSKSAVRKLIDYQNVKDSELFQYTELLKAARDRQAERYVEIINKLKPDLQRQRVIVLLGVRLTKQIRNRRMMRTALIQMARHFPDEPLYSLMLLDYYFPSRMYEEAFQALQRLYDRLAFEDAAMDARLSAAALVMGNPQDASAYADKALALEPGLELAWWSALRAQVTLADYSRAVETLQRLEKQHGHSLGPEALQRDKSFAELLASDEYTNWVASRN